MNSGPHNIQQLWTGLIIEELRRLGVDYFCLAPGLRCLPLARAVAETPGLQTLVHFDERGLAFHALGYAAASRRPAALICTSGTAAANFLPAVIEAAKKKLPLIILTADRPVELQKTGAHQTIDQRGLYGAYVRFEFELPAAGPKIDPAFVLTTVDQAVYRACHGQPGPVHLNVMFREPLTGPDANPGTDRAYDLTPQLSAWQARDTPYTQYFAPQIAPSPAAIDQILSQIEGIQNGIIAVGKLSSPQEQQAVEQIAARLNWPVWADISSGLRLGSTCPQLIPYYDHLLSVPGLFGTGQTGGRVDCILHLGGRLTSKLYDSWLTANPVASYIMVLNHPLRNDPRHVVTHRLQARVLDVCEALTPRLSPRPVSALLARMQTWSDACRSAQESWQSRHPEINEPGLAALIANEIPAGNGLFLASSMPVRLMDMFAPPQGRDIPIGSNRGASGIDGTVASAVGFARGLQRPVTLLIGDLALLHDLNSLAMLTETPVPLTIVVLNNGGGGIFSLLPGLAALPGSERYLSAAHDREFSHAAAMFSIPYRAPVDLAALRADYQWALAQPGPVMLEVRYTRAANTAAHHDLRRTLTQSLTPARRAANDERTD